MYFITVKIFTGFLKYNKLLLNQGKQLSCNEITNNLNSNQGIGTRTVANFCRRIIK